MLPKPPPREASLGFLFVPPFRIQGVSVAGEATAIQIPELDIGFDMGVPHKPLLTSKTLAISHGHMDHIGGLAYFCSQRHFQGMGPARLICDKRIEPAVRGMMEGFVDLERQRTPFELIGLAPEEEFEIKRNTMLRAFEVEHVGPAFGYSIVEKRSKLRIELVGLPQEKLRELKNRGEEITRTLEIPLVAYLGDTLPGPWLLREDVRKAKIVVCECTFSDDDHIDRAKIGKHMHVKDIAEWLPLLECEMLVLTHLSRRANMAQAQRRLQELVDEKHLHKVAFLMDHRGCRARYEKQLEDAEQAAEH